jgi:hypothetical protein
MYLQVKNTFKNNFYHTFKQARNKIEREEKHHENNELTNPFSPPPLRLFLFVLYGYIAYYLLDLENCQNFFP